MSMTIFTQNISGWKLIKKIIKILGKTQKLNNNNNTYTKVILTKKFDIYGKI